MTRTEANILQRLAILEAKMAYLDAREQYEKAGDYAVAQNVLYCKMCNQNVMDMMTNGTICGNQECPNGLCKDRI